MNNYSIMRQAAQARFCTYPSAELLKKPGVFLEDGSIATVFLGDAARVDLCTGVVTIAGQPADFNESLTIFDWLCDRRAEARAAGSFCPVGSLPGVLVSGSGLHMHVETLAAQIDRDPDAFRASCARMGGTPVRLGDIGYQLMAFPDLPLQLKFYYGDEEFPPSLTLLWDRNILQFIRYETVYYLAGCLLKRLEKKTFPQKDG